MVLGSRQCRGGESRLHRGSGSRQHRGGGSRRRRGQVLYLDQGSGKRGVARSSLIQALAGADGPTLGLGFNRAPPVHIPRCGVAKNDKGPKRESAYWHPIRRGEG